jgi:hypothetical protein
MLRLLSTRKIGLVALRSTGGSGLLKVHLATSSSVVWEAYDVEKDVSNLLFDTHIPFDRADASVGWSDGFMRRVRQVPVKV